MSELHTGPAPRAGASQAAPNVLNYFVGKGILKWKGPTDIDYVDLGNAPTFEITPSVTRLEHYSSRFGLRLKDLSVIIQKQMTVRCHLEELTTYNFALALMGSSVLDSGGTPGYDLIQIMDLGQLIGAFRLIGTNDIGQKVQVDLPHVSIGPSAAVPFIGDNAWAFLEVTGEVFIDTTTGSFGSIAVPITGEVISLVARDSAPQTVTLDATRQYMPTDDTTVTGSEVTRTQ